MGPLATKTSVIDQGELMSMKYQIDCLVGDQLLTWLTGESKEFEKPLRFHFNWPITDIITHPIGKRTRPLLLLAVARAIIGHHDHVLPEAVCLELVHNASLILDDVMDHDEVRRNRPSLWTKFGTSVATTTGVALYTMALESHNQLRRGGRQDVRSILLRSCVQTCTAQLLDLEMEGEIVDDPAQVLRVAAGRCALIASAAQLGAMLSDARPEVVENFRIFGECLGVARALSNDYRDIWGKIDETGNPVGGDIAQRKKTYPVVYALGNANQSARREIIEIFTHSDALSPIRIDRIRSLLGEAGSNDATLDQIRAHSSRAAMHLKATGIENAWTQWLLEMTRDPDLIVI